MNIKKHQQNIEILKELKDFGFHIDAPKKKFRKVGDLTVYEGEPCELLELIEVTEYRELWSVRFFNDSQQTFILL